MPRRLTQRVLRASVLLTTLIVAAGLSGCGKTESSASLLADARQYQQKGDNKAALIQLKNAASKNPDDAEVRFELARTYIETGDAVSAEKEIRRGLSLGVERSRALPLLARSLLMQGQPQRAIDESNADAAKGGPELSIARGDAYTALGDSTRAAEAYQQALAATPAAPGALVGMARLAMAANDVDGANRYLEQALAAHPKDPGVWMAKAAMARAAGKPDQALAAYSQVITFKPDHVNALVERANLHIEAGKYDAARTDIASAQKAMPGALIVSYTQALLDFKENKFAAAKESLQKVLRLAPDHMPSLLLSAAVELNLGAHQEAERHLAQYLEKYPADAYARKLLAQAMLGSARPAEASAALAPLLKDGARDSQLLALAGMSAAQARDFDKASGYFQQASAIEPDSVTLRTSLGLARLGQGKAAEGISELEKAAAQDPAAAEAGLALVRAELGLKQYDKALAAAARVEQNHPNNGPVHNLKGGAYLAKGDTADARASFEKAASLLPRDFAPVINLAQIDMSANNPESAKKRIAQFLEQNKKHTEAMFAMAEIAGREGKPEQVTSWLEKAAADNPNAAEPAVRLGAHYLAGKQPQKALTLARKASALNPTNTELLDLLGQSQIANKEFGGALDTYAALAKLAPRSAAAQLRLANVHTLMKDDAATAEDLKRALALQPDFLPARLAQVDLAVRRGKPEEALAIARALQAQFAKSPAGYTIEGDLQLQMQRPALALAAYDKAMAIAKSPRLVIGGATALRQMGKGNEARARLAQWHKANPADPTVAMVLAELHMANKQFQPAEELLQGVLKQQPNNPVVLNNLAWTYQQTKDPRALEMAERAAKLAPESPAVLDTLGWTLSEQGNTERALPLLKKALAAAPDAAETRYHLAATLYKAGDKPGARKELEKLLSDNKPFAQSEEAKALLKLL